MHRVLAMLLFFAFSFSVQADEPQKPKVKLFTIGKNNKCNFPGPTGPTGTTRPGRSKS